MTFHLENKRKYLIEFQTILHKILVHYIKKFYKRQIENLEDSTG